MSGKVRFISDFHFNHEFMAQRRGFENTDTMNNYIIEKYNSVVDKKDSTYILGDITMERKKGYDLLNELNGYKHIVLGNHDRRQDVREMLKYVNGVAGVIKYKQEFILTHCPVHECQLKFKYKYNIHGHVHENSVTKYDWDYLSGVDKEMYDNRYINVCCENIDYIPKTLNELLKK